MKKRLCVSIYLLGVSLFVLFMPVQAQLNCSVPSGSYATIQAAINDASCTTIIVSNGTFTENLVINRDVTIIGQGAGLTVIDGGNTARSVEVQSGATVTLQNLTVTNGNSGAANGGGIINNGTSLTLNRVTVSNSTGNIGGGVYNAAGTLNIQNSTISGNNATLRGGGVGNDTGVVNITSSTLDNNVSATIGGGVFSLQGTVFVTNSTISNNQANRGGGLFNDLGSTTVTHSTLTGNSASNSGGAVYNAHNNSLTISNSILANSVSGDDCGGGQTDSTVTTLGFNIVESIGRNCGFSAMASDQVGVDPVLDGALASNGGPTQTFALLAGSPAIDAISAGQSGCTAGSSTDQRGAVRAGGTNRGGSACDIGAYEANLSESPTAVSLTTFSVRPNPFPVSMLLVLFLTGVGQIVWQRRHKRYH